MKKNYILLTLFILFVFLLTACGNSTTSKIITTKTPTGPMYYDDELDNPLKDLVIEGNDTLSLIEKEEDITLENQNIRVIFDKTTGGIKELVNKKAKVYLLKNITSKPLEYCRVKEATLEDQYLSFSYEINENTSDNKEIELSWKINDKSTIIVNAILKKDDDSIVFNLSINENDLDDSFFYVGYPIIENIDTLYEKERDYLVHPIAMGELFNNPVENFNKDNIKGIKLSQGMYPSGWNTPMQYYAYYSKGIGGFMFMTEDGGDGIKSFSIIGENKKLKASIYHFVDDIGKTNINFNYDIKIRDLVEGTWEETADIYKEWAIKQSWCSKGRIEDRDDIDQSFYLDTVECNFNYPYGTIYGRDNQKSLYDKLKENFKGKILNIYIVDDQIIDLAKENGDYSIQFEFPHFHNVKSANNTPSEWNNKLTTIYGEPIYYDVEGTLNFFECPSCLDYREKFLNTEKDHYVYNKVSGYYHDVGIGAGIQQYCFNTSHPHGTRINVMKEYLEQIREIKEYGISVGANLYGQELCSELMIPYMDFFQARGNAGVMAFWEIERFRPLVEEGSARPITLFDYVYSEYGPKRLDGVGYADELLGDGYYYNMAYTSLYGGIPEYNFEFIKNGNFIDPEDQSAEMMAFVGYLGSIKTGIAQKYLTYGAMQKAPETGAGSIEYDYIQERSTKDEQGGVVVQPKVITSAFKYKGKIAIFLCNHTRKDLTVNFILNALRDYKVSSGNIYLVYDNGVRESLTNIIDGKAKISLTLESRKVFMLEFDA